MLIAKFKKYTLQFKFDAGTSRGVLKEKDTWFIILEDTNNLNLVGIGEASLIKNLSIDDRLDFEETLGTILSKVSLIKSINDIYTLVPLEFPSIRFALETAWLDLKLGGKRKIFDTFFYNGIEKIHINGLVWMNNVNEMYNQAMEKIEEGYTCIKFKVGSLRHREELQLIEKLRKSMPSQDKLVIRLDANGAWERTSALKKIFDYSKYQIHSIEQPITAGYPNMMHAVVSKSYIPIALDEELIGVHEINAKHYLLDKIKPSYIVLKPSLLGGIKATIEWVELAKTKKIGYWITSALESNIGLNTIAQLASHLDPHKVHGLGTGNLYNNNIQSPLKVKNGTIFYDIAEKWDLTPILS